MSGEPLDPALFNPEAVSAETRAFNATLRERMRGQPKAWEPGGKRAFTNPVSARARDMTVEVAGREPVGLHVIAPEQPTGVYLHLHGGGLILGHACDQDPTLERIADSTGMACASVEYRLAPAHPWPAAWDDCETAALWLAGNARAEFGTEVLTIGGESAGATLAVPTLVRMRDKHGYTGFRAANLSYGNYDTTMTPSQRWIGERSFFLDTHDIQHCTEQYAPDPATRRDPDMSPLYADLRGLPPALFTVGTLDPFLDDSLFLHARWIAGGNQAELAVYPGGIHSFIMFDYPLAQAANARIDAFLAAHVAG